MSSLIEDLSLVPIDGYSVEDPTFKVKLSVLARLQSDAEYYADEAKQYKIIRNKLVSERAAMQNELKISRAETAYVGKECEGLAQELADAIITITMLTNQVEKLIELSNERV